MQSTQIFKEYIWLVNTIYKHKRISLREINKLWVETEFSKDKENNWAYVNLLRTKDFILVPGLGTDSDSEALKQIELLYPNYEGRIHQVNIAPIVEKYGGAFNCLTWTIK